MTDLEIDKALALAIGWKPEQLWNRETYLLLPMRFDGFEHWQRFSHKDWNVIGPIAERYNAFPWQSSNGKWYRFCSHDDVYTKGEDTPQRAIALEVIEVEGAKK